MNGSAPRSVALACSATANNLLSRRRPPKRDRELRRRNAAQHPEKHKASGARSCGDLERPWKRSSRPGEPEAKPFVHCHAGHQQQKQRLLHPGAHAPGLLPCQEHAVLTAGFPLSLAASHFRALRASPASSRARILFPSETDVPVLSPADLMSWKAKVPEPKRQSSARGTRLGGRY